MIRLCPLCQGKPWVQMGRLRQYHYCPRCQLGWRKKFLKITYSQEYYLGKSGLGRRFFQPLKAFSYYQRGAYAGKNKKDFWIDVGAGEGDFLKTVNAAQRLGVEISAPGRKMMKNAGLEAISAKEFLKSKELKADVISFWHVLEHLPQPWNYLRVARRNLQKNGKLVIGVPNLESFSFKFFGKHWFHLQPEYHYWHFSPKSLKKMLTQVGFKTQKIDWWSPEHSLAGILQTLLNASAGSKNVLHQLVKRGAGFSVLTAKDIFWIFFWLSLGLPVVFLFWVVGAITHHSDSVVMVATVIK